MAAPLEPTNEGYALSKITGSRLCYYITQSHENRHYKTLIPSNLFRTKDHFGSVASHLIAVIVSKVVQARDAVRSSKYLGRALWRQVTEYRRRSHVETTPSAIAAQYPAGQWMHCLKLLGLRLSARDFDRQVAEIQIRAVILNGFTARGIPRTVTLG
jgi:hypothetical protein